jgi:hypothetical protein
MLDLPIGPSTAAKDILKPGALTEYEQGMTFLYYELIELNVNIYLVDQILRFPLKLFLLEERAGKDIFLSQFIDNTMYISILSITRLVADDSPDVFTMNTFQNRLLQLVKPEYKAAYKERLRDNRFSDPEIRSIRNKAKDFRNKRLAHLTQDYFQQVYDKTIKIINIYFPDVKALCEKLNRSFSNLAFDAEYIMLPNEYWDDQPASYKSDIEEILDSIAKNSHILSLPETSPLRWRVVLPTLTQSDLSQLNQYRRKFGMPEV